MFLSRLRRALLGSPLHSKQIEHEKLPVWRALPVFSSDALSSVAYATEEILVVLFALGVAASVWSIPVALAIAALLIIVAISYQQTLTVYPNGGGAYQVARENLGVTPSLVAGAALLIDYILTVAVSISAGSAAIVSAFPELAPYRVTIAIVLVMVMTLGNLRGLRESSSIFSIPTYLFIGTITLLIGVGFYRYLTGSLQPQVNIIEEYYPAISLWIILRAFSSGCAALTGIEAISNGVPAFKSPSSRNAKKTMIIMIAILAVFFLSITLLGHLQLVVPRADETVLSQIARLIFGTGPLYYLVQMATAGILVMAANTAFADFPRLASLMAADRYMPRQLGALGDRLVFSNGILLLGASAICLIFLFSADVHALIPLYSVGVFASFTLSQSGMVVHHIKYREQGWRVSLGLNLFGGIATLLVMLVVAVTKFTDGAWLTVVVIPALILMFRTIKRHYITVAKQLLLKNETTISKPVPSLVVLPISGFHAGVVKALQYARGISSEVHVVTVNIQPIATKNLNESWKKYVPQDGRQKLVVLESPYRSVIQPLMEYMNQLEREFPDRTLTVVVPEFTTKRWWANFLHNQTSFFLKARLRFVPYRVVVSVNYVIDE